RWFERNKDTRCHGRTSILARDPNHGPAIGSVLGCKCHLADPIDIGKWQRGGLAVVGRVQIIDEERLRWRQFRKRLWRAGSRQQRDSGGLLVFGDSLRAG